MNHKLMQLDFAPGARTASARSLTLLLVCACVLFLSVLALARNLAHNATQAQELAQLEGSSGRTAPFDPQHVRNDPQELARVQFVRKTARNLATPWAELLASLEATPNTVALISVEPTAAKRSVTLTAEAASAAQMLAYLQILQSDKRLNEVVLVSHQVQLKAPGTPLRFRLEAQWGEGS